MTLRTGLITFTIITVLTAPAMAFVNPNDFSWMRQDFNTQNYTWMQHGTRGAISIPGMPITINNAVYPPGWQLKPRKDGTFTLVPPKSKNDNGSSSQGKRKGR